jgi:hypothetical protein
MEDAKLRRLGTLLAVLGSLASISPARAAQVAFQTLPSSSIGCPVSSDPITIRVGTSQGTFSGTGSIPTCDRLPIEPAVINVAIYPQDPPSNLLVLGFPEHFQSSGATDLTVSFEGDVVGSVRLAVRQTTPHGVLMIYDAASDGITGSFEDSLPVATVEVLSQDFSISIPSVPEFAAPIPLADGMPLFVVAPFGGGPKHYPILGSFAVNPDGTELRFSQEVREGPSGLFRDLSSGLPDNIDYVQLSIPSLRAGGLDIVASGPFPIPEPSSGLLLAFGLGTLAAGRRRA